MTASKNKPRTILIVDDHPVAREGLALRISSQRGLEVCGEAADPAEALTLIAKKNPDVAIIDITLKNGNGIDLIKRIKARHPGVRILVWSMHDDELFAERALRAGALGYINKGQATDNIIEAIRQVLEGRVYVSHGVVEQMLQRTVGSVVADVNRSPVEALSDRELQVFELLGQGLTSSQIADKIHLSPRTVDTYRARIKEKLNLSDGRNLLQHAMHWVMENH